MNKIFQDTIDAFEDSTPKVMKQIQAIVITILKTNISLTARDKKRIIYAQFSTILSITKCPYLSSFKKSYNDR